MTQSAERRQALYLLDATLLFFRALYGLPDVFADDAGRSINGLRGYLTYLVNLLRGQGAAGVEAPVRYCAAAFDESLNSCWRNTRYPAYKANRPPADENIAYQLGLARTVTEWLGVPVLTDPDYEADDFIAALAKRSRRPVIVVSRDKDLQQLLSDRVSLLDPKDGRRTDPEAFESAFGFAPTLFPDYQAFTGDSVDNIPGIRGIGPKGAGALIRSFGSLENVYDAESRWIEAGIKPDSRLAGRLVEDREQAFLFRDILRLEDRAPLPFGTDRTRLARPDGGALFRELDRQGLGRGLGRSLMDAMEAYVG